VPLYVGSIRKRPMEMKKMDKAKSKCKENEMEADK
jgi:hypothetical protein